MNTFISQVKRFVADEEGAAAVEYGLMVGLIAVVIIATVTSLGTELNNKFTAVLNALRAAAVPA
ncbi:MAG: Flp family type IVb pilin [Herminiimonas sp.]|nr:Flp family type IVb pilin [Herminiimonas sp.]